MKLLSIIVARSTWFFPLTDLNPRGRYIHPIAKGLPDRYDFVKYPEKMEDMEEGAKFEDGKFKTSRDDAITVSLTLHESGIVGDTRSSTTDSDEFLDDMLNWLCAEFGLAPSQEIVRRKVYLSAVHVHMDGSLNLLNPKLEPFARQLSSKVVGYDPVMFETFGIMFWKDPKKTGPEFSFRLERAETEPFSQQRYFSLAPLQTETHLELLEELERILTS